MSSYRFTFRKEERLHSLKLIQAIFAKQETRTAFSHPLLAIYRVQPLDTPYPAQVLFSVPKKKFRRANRRNRIRRMLREQYRLKKKLLYDHLSTQRLQCALVIVYTAAEEEPAAQLARAYDRLFEKISKDIG